MVACYTGLCGQFISHSALILTLNNNGLKIWTYISTNYLCSLIDFNRRSRFLSNFEVNSKISFTQSFIMEDTLRWDYLTAWKQTTFSRLICPAMWQDTGLLEYFNDCTLWEKSNWHCSSWFLNNKLIINKLGEQDTRASLECK